MQEQINAVQRMQDYIEENLYTQITLSDLANVSYFSPWYSHRIFKKFTGFSPAEYIRRLKLSKSALKLKNEKIRVIDVAFDMGFKSVDGYQRAFFKEFGCNPYKYSQNPVPVYLFIPYGVKYQTIKKEKKSMKKTENIFIKEIEKPERKVIIKRGVKATNYFEYCNEVGCDIWGLLVSMCSKETEPVCMWLPKKYVKSGTSSYVQGVEVPIDYSGDIPEDMDIITLPSSKYLLFQGEPFAEEDYCDAILNIQKVIDNYDVSLLNYQLDSDNPRIQLEPLGKRGYIEMIAVK